MRKITILFAAIVSFFVFSAQNCTKRDPINEQGSVSNPDRLGLPSIAQGAFRITTINSGQNVAGANVTISNKKGSAALRTYVSTDSFVFAGNLFTGVRYHFSASYFNSGTNKTMVADTDFTAGSTQIPQDATLELR